MKHSKISTSHPTHCLIKDSSSPTTPKHECYIDEPNDNEKKYGLCTGDFVEAMNGQRPWLKVRELCGKCELYWGEILLGIRCQNIDYPISIAAP
jgi:hypothetical protein